jgi:hypothetical protein
MQRNWDNEPEWSVAEAIILPNSRHQFSHEPRDRDSFAVFVRMHQLPRHPAASIRADCVVDDELPSSAIYATELTGGFPLIALSADSTGIIANWFQSIFAVTAKKWHRELAIGC